MVDLVRVLFLEDVEDDQMLLERELERAGLSIRGERVQTAEQMRERLAEHEWDVVLSDYSMPGFTAVDALAIYKERQLDIPFIVVSGTIGEDAAVEVLKGGAHDFVLKDRLARLAPAVRRELKDAATRRAKRVAETAAHQAEQRFRRIVETAQEGVWMVDVRGYTTYVNERVAQMLGTTVEALMGMQLMDAVELESVESVSQRLLQRGTPKTSTERIECKLRRHDGSNILVSMAVNPIDDGNGHGLGQLAMIVDITEQRALQEQLMVSDRMASLGTLAAGVAHEINNPLAVILTNVQLATDEIARLAICYDDPTLSGDLKEELDDARDATRRLRDIVRDLKIFSRVREAQRGPLDVLPVLESSLRMVWNEVRHRAKVTRNYQEIPLVDGNESKLGQVFLNLLANAVQALDETKSDTNEIGIATRYDDRGNVVIEISDTGSGMDAEVQRRIFTPFFTTKPVGIGTGLGLTICRSIIHSLGGEISVDSKLGVGTTFRITLRRATGDAPVLLPEPEPIASTRRAKILIVDDEPIIGTTLRRLLTDHEVTLQSDALKALNDIEAGARYDIILCDLMMPDLTGMELYARLLARVPAQAACVVFMTGGAFTPRSQAFLSKVSNPHLEKPFDARSLKNLINTQLLGVLVPQIE